MELRKVAILDWEWGKIQPLEKAENPVLLTYNNL